MMIRMVWWSGWEQANYQSKEQRSNFGLEEQSVEFAEKKAAVEIQVFYRIINGLVALVQVERTVDAASILRKYVKLYVSHQKTRVCIWIQVVRWTISDEV